MTKHRNILILFSLMLCQLSIFAQKEERETGVSREEVPEKALIFIKDQGLMGKVKWYKETTSGRDSYESKFKFDGRYFSVEFDTLGNIEDIEILIQPKSLSKDKKSLFKEALLKEFKKFKWVKIQEQYTGEEKELKQIFENKFDDAELNYEIEAEVKLKDGNWKMYELLIDPDGRIVKKREVTLRPTDNLNY